MERLQHEFAAIGFYLSSHPLAAYERSLQRLGVTRAADLAMLLHRGVPGRIKLAGTVIDRAELEALRKTLEGKRGRGKVTLVVPMSEDSQAEVILPGSYSIAAGLRDA